MESREAVRWIGAGITGACVRRQACVLCVLAALTPSLCFAPNTLAAETGGITGVVTELSPPQAAIQGIEVCASPANFEEANFEEFFAEGFGCAKTNASGEYTITGLAGGKYDVAFHPPANSKLNFVAQYYDAKTFYEEATPVSVSGGATTPGIDAKLEEGGLISGTVTRASGGAPIAGIEVCAFSIRFESYGCATSEANGEYAIAGLRGGVKYDVEFTSPPKGGLDYVTQYYDGKFSSKAAETVLVSTGQTTSGIDAKLEEGGFVSGRVTDAATDAPLAHALVCAIAESVSLEQCAETGANGEYTSPVLASGSYKLMFIAAKYTIQYYNDRPSLASADAVVVSVGETTSGINATLQLTPAKSAKGTSGPPHPVPAPPVSPPPIAVEPPRPLAEIAAEKIVVWGGSARGVQVVCAGARCQGSVELTMQIVVKRRKGGRTVAHKETLVLAKGLYSVAAGDSSAVVLHLTATGRQRLAHVKRHPLRAKLTLSVTGGAPASQSVLIR
jgi:Carboxypeptidase regulatory-like domain